MVESGRETSGRIERETRFYITPLALLAAALGPLVRDHRAVENGLPWVMDMVFRDAECRVRKDRAPVNFTTIKHRASKPMRNAAAKGAMRLKRKAAAWNDDFLARAIMRNDSFTRFPWVNGGVLRQERFIVWIVRFDPAPGWVPARAGETRCVFPMRAGRWTSKPGNQGQGQGQGDAGLGSRHLSGFG